MPLDPKFNKFSTASPILASFDFLDVEEGAGFRNYNASDTRETSNTTYFMTRATNPSDGIYTFQNSGAGSMTELFNVDFDLTFQAAQTMAKGTAYFILALGMGADVTSVKDMKAVITLKKNTTTIGSSVESKAITRPDGTAANTPYSRMVNVPLVIASRVHFAIGDVLRVNVAIHGQNSAGGTADFALGHDPADRVDPRATSSAKRIFEDAQSTKSIFAIPFVITP